ncbi:hypothetical protein ACFO4L_00680 [Bacillus daqingensis]|uniref:Uncharacterized protein n=1 Tax=Bacillus daqingensis TaxID=872396 RepID=A0ABV9NT48_9BACI
MNTMWLIFWVLLPLFAFMSIRRRRKAGLEGWKTAVTPISMLSAAVIIAVPYTFSLPYETPAAAAAFVLLIVGALFTKYNRAPEQGAA